MLKWITVEQVRLGMYIQELEGSWIKHPFWRSKFLLEAKTDLNLLATSGIRRVRIDISKGLDIAAARAPAQPRPAEPPQPAPPPVSAKPQTTTAAEEMASAARICSRSKEVVTALFQEARMGRTIDAGNVAPLVEDISASMSRNRTALVSLARLKTKDDYTYMHSVAVCALMIALGRQLQLPEDQIHSAGVAGMLHDLGKATSPLEILNKPGKLTDSEYGVMKKHPVAGHAMLVEADLTDDIALDVCLHHHEKIDGSGYPDKLSGDGISLFARMGAICDVYDAVTSDRPYNKGWDPAETIHRMADWKGHFDMRVFAAFVKSLGIYPVGSLVRLESGRLGVVVEQSQKSLTTPVIKVFFSTKSRSHLMPEALDLSNPHCTDRIVARELAQNWGLKNLDELWMG